MDCLEILHAEAPEVFLRSGYGGVPENPPQEFQIPTPPEILAGERVTTGMRGHTNPGEFQPLSNRSNFSRIVWCSHSRRKTDATGLVCRQSHHDHLVHEVRHVSQYLCHPLLLVQAGNDDGDPLALIHGRARIRAL